MAKTITIATESQEDSTQTERATINKHGKQVQHEDLITLQQTGEYFAAVDMGSNSFHLVVVHVINGNVQVVSKVKQKVRLAAGLNRHNYLSEEAMHRGWNCLKTFADRLKHIPDKNIKVVATATARLAVNAQQFLTPAESILQHNINVISGEEEASYIYRGVAYTSTTSGTSLVIDIGGASTEVIVGRDLIPMHLHSFNIGCVTFTERFFADGKLNEANFKKAVSFAENEMAPYANSFKCFDWQLCLGASGTPQAIVEILQNQGYKDAIRLSYLQELQRQCCTYDSIDTLDIPGLAESRQAIFPSGLAILTALFNVLDIDNMHLAGGALREGLIYGMIANQPLDERRNQALGIVMKRFHIEEQQARQVTHTALGLFHQLHMQSQLCSIDSRTLLYSASMLHEIGLLIDYKKQEEHAAYILGSFDLSGFTKLQRECIAMLVGNHRGNIKTEQFFSFPGDMQETLLNLTRILRLAIILHVKRNHSPDLLDKAHVTLTVNDSHWELSLSDAWIKQNRLVFAELANEAWLQHKANLNLSIETVKIDENNKTSD